MSKVFTSEDTGAAAYVFSDDHCPPHVHARHRGEGWTARVSFSYLASATELMSIEPVKNVPMRRVVNRLLDEIQDRLSNCRSSWWKIRRTTCLANEWAMVRAPGNVVVSDHVPGAKQIADADYDPTNELLRLVFRDGTAEEVRLRP